MIQYIVLFYIILAFVLASYEDIKKREVYDYLNFTLAFLILITAIFHSFLINSTLPIKAVGFGLLIGFVLGSFLYYIGLWGGGDSKFLIGFSAASYYLIGFSNSSSFMHHVYERIMNEFSLFLIPFLNSFIKIVLVIDYIALLILFGVIIFTKKNLEKIQLISILALLTYGLHTQTSEISLVIIGFFTFILLFFAREDLFSSIYIRIDKKISELKINDRIDSDIKKSNKIIIPFIEAKDGLSNEQIMLLEKEFKNNKILQIRKILSISSLVSINFICFVLLIVTLNQLNLDILSFLLKFIFFSFFVGGILGIIIILFFTIKNYKKIKLNLNIFEKIILVCLSSLSIALSFLDTKFFIIILLAFIYLFIKISKQVEKIIFISKKPLSKIVPGDWIVEDIVVNKTKIYTKEDFKLGINEEQLERIHKLAKSHKNLNSIKVKDGIPFLPPLFIAFLFMILI